MEPNVASAPSLDSVPEGLVCPLCDGDSVVTVQHWESLNYGSGDSAVKLQVDLPVRRCEACEFDFVDHEGERRRHEAVCRHLGVLPPAEVRAIRKRYGMSRATFARATGLGEATLGRWERGALIQNRANDRYLRLLGHPWNMRALRCWSAPANGVRGKQVR